MTVLKNSQASCENDPKVNAMDLIIRTLEKKGVNDIKDVVVNNRNMSFNKKYGLVIKG